VDDLNNWGLHKRLIGEVDVFQVDSTHELYGHMNVNYLRLASLPSFDRWSDALAALAGGDYFTTTGEVLLPRASFVPSGDQVAIRVTASWTFPLRMAEMVWGDGRQTYRQTISLADTREFDRREFTWQLTAPGWKWVRLAVWDIAGDGAFTTPIWKN
jgi:hypothetical protein